MVVKLGIIGCGKITERACLPNLKDHPQTKISCLCDINKSAAQNLIKKFELEAVDIYTDYEEMLKRDDLDAVYVATPNYLHEPMAVAAAEHKKHILVEKPITISVKAADEMIKAAKKNNVFLMVEQTQRFDPVHQAAKEVIDSGILGKINIIRGRIGHAGPEYWTKTSDWFYDKKKSGGGAMIDIGVHIADLVRWFAGKKVKAVCADITRLEKKMPVDDNGNILLKFDDGSIGGFECSWTTRPYEVNTFIYGEKGKMTTSLGRANPVIVTLAKTQKGEDPNCTLQEITPGIGPGGGWTNAMHYFIKCVLEKRKPFVDGEEGRATIAVILAAYKSAEEGKWVEL